MEWSALELSLLLSGLTCLVLIPASIPLARWLAFTRFRARSFVEALVALPLVLPPTVLGYYLLIGFGADTLLARVYQSLVGRGLVFTFDGLLLASLLFNVHFAVQPIQRAFETVGRDLRHAAYVSGMSAWMTFWRIELPLAWPGLISALALTFAHTLGEFGVVLMVGGNIAGETRTIAIAIYDRVQAFDQHAAGVMSAALLGLSFVAIAVVYMLAPRPQSDRD